MGIIKRKIKDCKKCGKPSYIWAKGCCKICASKIKNEKEKDAVVQYGQRAVGCIKKAKKKETGELEVFREIFKERGGRSEISGAPLYPEGHKLFHWQFMHVCPKSIHSKLRLDKRNIMLGTVNEHLLQTNQPHKTKDDPKWAKFWERYEELSERYGKV